MTATPQPHPPMESNSEEQSVSSSSDPSTTTGDCTSSPACTPRTLGQTQENKMVNRSKGLVYLVVLLSATAMAMATYFFVSGGEDDDFKTAVRLASRLDPFIFTPHPDLTLFLPIHCDSLLDLPRRSSPYRRIRSSSSLRLVVVSAKPRLVIGLITALRSPFFSCRSSRFGQPRLESFLKRSLSSGLPLSSRKNAKNGSGGPLETKLGLTTASSTRAETPYGPERSLRRYTPSPKRKISKIATSSFLYGKWDRLQGTHLLS